MTKTSHTLNSDLATADRGGKYNRRILQFHSIGKKLIGIKFIVMFWTY